MELIYYLGLLCVALWLARLKAPIERKTVLVCLAIFTLTSVVVRMAGYESDIPVYAERMKLTEHDPYFLREPLTWYFHRLLFLVTKSDFIALVISDVLIYAVVCASLYSERVPAYALISIIVFFPFVLGMQNVYKQWVACAFLMLAVSGSNKSVVKSLVFYTLAILSHSAAAFFLPIVLAKTRWRHVALVFSVILLPIALYLGSHTRIASYSGADLGLAYFVLLATLAIGWLLVSNEPKRWWSSPGFICLGYAAYIVLAGVVLLPSSGAERLGLFGLLVCYPILVRLIEDKTPYWYMRSALILGGFLPLLVFDTRKFLM